MEAKRKSLALWAMFVLFHVIQHLFQVLDCFRSVGTSHLEHDTTDTLVTVHGGVEAIGVTSQFDVGHVFQAQQFSVGQ